MATATTMIRRITNTQAVASSQWRNPSIRHSSEVELALQAVESANAVPGTNVKSVAPTTYLYVAMRFEENPCTFDLRVQRL
jgi:hypothetical protein